ncbi:MAG: HPr kinase/phosphatase C-terminal domain-containing protein [Alphaproteobacteria bacterium]|nr:HPr kinase/phosphatase C-terminal domain-containing protein [Alphaproteobacteria bacterium]
MTASVNIHATCVRIGSAGVLLLGKSGAGKSDLALRLIQRGATLVADDRTMLTVERGALVARPPTTIAGLIEVRGMGIVPVRHAASARVALVIDLSGKPERLPEPRSYVPPTPLTLKHRPPPYALHAFEASAPDKVVAALSLRRRGTKRSQVKRI